MHKVVLITGASRGIGAATALLAAQQGWSVAVNYVANSLAADDVVRQIRAAGGTAMAVKADVANEAITKLTLSPPPATKSISQVCGFLPFLVDSTRMKA